MNVLRRRGVFATLTVVVVAVGSMLSSIAPVSAAAPKIFGFTPKIGPVGTPVWITGSGFIGTTAVDFGATAAAFSVVSTTTIYTTVPNGAVSATISVQTPSGKVTSGTQSYTVTPWITGESTTSGPVGTSVTITGTNLTSATQVTFNGVAATVTADSSTQISTSVPAGATTGPIAVTTASGTAYSATLFSIGTPQVFDVTNYGAIADGTGDNTAAFHAAIAAAQAAGDGSIVSIPAGTYMFTTGSPASIQIGGTVPIVLAGASRDTTKLVEATINKDLISVKGSWTVVQDLALDTQTYNGGHPIGDGASYTTIQRMNIVDGTNTFGIYLSGPPKAHPGNGLYSEDNVVNDVILNDHYAGDGFSFSFQDHGTVSNIVHTGSHITLYGDENTTITNYNYTPGAFGRTAGFIISTPCDNMTITNFVTSGEGGQIRTAPTVARVNQNIVINGEVMTGSSAMRLLIGDVQGLLVENSTLKGIMVTPTIIAQGMVHATTYTSVTNRPQKSGVIKITYS